MATPVIERMETLPRSQEEGGGFILFYVRFTKQGYAAPAFVAILEDTHFSDLWLSLGHEQLFRLNSWDAKEPYDAEIQTVRLRQRLVDSGLTEAQMATLMEIFIEARLLYQMELCSRQPTT